MKWNLTPDKKGWKNYKGEEFKGKMSKDLNPGDQFEEEMNDGKKLLFTLDKKEVREDGTTVVYLSGSDLNG